jgi:estrone sulfotransferase
MTARLIQRAVRKGRTRFIPSFVRLALKPILTHVGGFDPRLLDLGIDAVRHDDCFFASYPRSGNTWLRFIVASLLAPSEEISFRNADRFIPDPERVTFDIEEMASPRIIKTHWPYFDLFPRCIYVIRDPRDVIISYYHYASNNGWFAGDLESFCLFRAKYGDWADHVNRALNYAEEHPDNILLLKYEKLLRRPVAEVARLVRFLGLNSSDTEIGAAIKKNSFTSLQERERARGPAHGTAEGFFREGTAQQWRRRLSPEQIHRITQDNRPLIEKLGYELA